MRRFILFSAFCFLFSALTGCDKINFLKPRKTAPSGVSAAAQSAVRGTVIARVNDTPITLEDLNQEIEMYNAAVPEDKPELKITTREKKLEYLKNDMVRRAILYQQALKLGLDKKDDIANALEKTKANLLVVGLIKQEADKISVSSQEIENYYNTYKEELKEPEERSIREIVVPVEQDAREILIQLLQGADFATLAKERSKDKSAPKGGDMGFIQKGSSFKELENIANALDVGQVSSSFKGPDGYYIIKLDGRRGGKQKSLSEMWDDIKRALTFIKQQKHVEDLIGKLSSEAKLEILEGEIR